MYVVFGYSKHGRESVLGEHGNWVRVKDAGLSGQLVSGHYHSIQVALFQTEEEAKCVGFIHWMK